MSRIDDLIAEHCPSGVELKRLGDIVRIKNGKDHKTLGDGEFPVYGSGGIMRYADTYAYNKPSVLIPRKGSLGNLFLVDVPFWNVDTIFYTEIDEVQIRPKFLYYFLTTAGLGDMNQAGGVPSQTQSVLNELTIPVPPLEVQHEIVRILDAFAELTAELTARKKQYHYYRDQLLRFKGDEVEWKALGEIGDVKMCKRILKSETQSEGDVPFYKIGTFGKQADAFISEEIYESYKSRYSFPKTGDVLISAAGTIGRAVVYDGKPAYFQDSNIVWLDNDESIVSNRYLWHCYKIVNWFVSGGGTIDRLYNDNIKKTKIPVPYPNNPEKSLTEQARIVAILDKFDALVNDLSSGLPAEIKARRQQYEHYRDKLLSFAELEATA